LKLSNTYKGISVLLSGIFFYFGNGLDGNFGWLMWIAPIPVLYVSLNVKPVQAFLLAFMAYLIGRFSWLPYLLIVLPAPLAILFTLLLPLIFALIVIASRKLNQLTNHWISALAFPFLFTSFEYILFNFSKDGTAASIAYTQSKNLPLIQIASLTGILGITFLITLIPSVISMAWYNWKNKKSASQLLALLLVLLSFSFAYGLIRINQPDSGDPKLLGMAAVDESAYKGVYDHDPDKEMQLTDLYLQAASKLADQGAKIILLPEKAIIVHDSTNDLILQKFTRLAINRKIRIIIGVTKQKTGYYLNNAWVISDQGKLLADYQKVNLFEGEILDGCKPGTDTGIFHEGKMNEGVAVCKDMDFQQFILGYSKKSPAILYVPAWDFVQDGWLHARMAILRSVEGGFSLARNARQGRLTLSDWRGKVLYEANSEAGIPTELTGKLFVEPHPTIYARAGDWFGTISVFAAIGFIVFMIRKRQEQPGNSA
jgi:apolipoprotein N-acyltransferase